jgi:hypothetical protein
MEDGAMTFTPLSVEERNKLLSALKSNANGDVALLVDRRDTSFAGTAEDIPDEQVITAIKSVPCHY